MNLLFGKRMDRQESFAVLDGLQASVARTLFHARPLAKTVLEACGELRAAIDPERYLPMLCETGLSVSAARRQLAEAMAMLDPEYLLSRMERELGQNPLEPISFVPMGRELPVREQWQPLGVLFHIAAGNVEALPAFTVIEGLLTGNINILKLPGSEDGLSVLLLEELIRLAPELSEYIYVFDYPSEETERMERMADVADAIVVWGSDAAITAVRRMAKPNVRIIEWGHKLSFAYVTRAGMEDGQILQLATHISLTNQLPCSSCQGIFLDTQSEEEAQQFCQSFLSVLERAGKAEPRMLDTAMQAHLTLKLRTEALLTTFQGGWLYEGTQGSVHYYPDFKLHSALQFRNCWVRRLPRMQLVEKLRPYRGYLQTAGLLCGEEEREILSERLFRAGVIRVTRPEHMSDTYCGAAHDGAYALRNYMKRVSLE